MIVCDSAGRVLELAQLLEQLWQRLVALFEYKIQYIYFSKTPGLIGHNIAMLSNVAGAVIEAAKSQVEWMSSEILKHCEAGLPNPFQFRYLKCCHSMAEL